MEKIDDQNVSDCIKFIRAAIEAAVKFVKFAADQVASLYTEFSDRSALAPNLTKILLAAERKGKISARDAQLAFTPKLRPNAQTIRAWFGELAALNYELVKNSGKSLIFEITAKSTDHFSTIASNSILSSVSASTVSGSTVYNRLQSPTPTVDTVDEMIYNRLQSEPIQRESSRSIVDDDLLFATSKNFPTDENVTKDNFENYIEGILLDILKFIQQSGGQISTRDLCRSRFQRIPVEGKKLTTSTAAKLLREIAAAGFGSFSERGNKKIFTLNGQLSSTVINCHQLSSS